MATNSEISEASKPAADLPDRADAPMTDAARPNFSARLDGLCSKLRQNYDTRPVIPAEWDAACGEDQISPDPPDI
jgi:hypothetical protein